MLRPVRSMDCSMILNWRNSSIVRSRMFSREIIGESEHLDWWANLAGRSDQLWWLHTDSKGIPDGVVYFKDIDTVLGSANWGLYKRPGAPPGTGLKIGGEALLKVYEERSISRVEAWVLSSNLPSLKLHENLGFRIVDLYNRAHEDLPKVDISEVKYLVLDKQGDRSERVNI